jgi:hypothetical protein
MKNTFEQHKRWKNDPSKGEVFTPVELVNEMLDKIPASVWENPSSTFLDPCMGKGTFLIEIVNRLVYIYGYSKEDAISRVYGYDIRIKYINLIKRGGLVNIFYKDFLNEKFNMKFDVIVGNPPYNNDGGIKKGGKNLYSKFIDKSIDLVKENGFLTFVTNAGYLKTTTEKRTDLLEKMLSKNLIYLNIGECKKWFPNVGGAMIFSYFLLQNNDEYSSTKCVTQLELTSKVYEDTVVLNDMNWIPRVLTNDVISIIKKCQNKTFKFERIDGVENRNINTENVVGFKRLNHLVKPYSVMATRNINSGTFIITKSDNIENDINFFNSKLFSFLNVIHRYDPIIYHKLLIVFGRPTESLTESENKFINDLIS